MSVPDLSVRMAAVAWLADQVAAHGDVLDWGLLLKGFEFDGRRVPLLSQQGIFKPAVCQLPLTIRTTTKSPYDDHSAAVIDRVVHHATILKTEGESYRLKDAKKRKRAC